MTKAQKWDKKEAIGDCVKLQMISSEDFVNFLLSNILELNAKQSLLYFMAHLVKLGGFFIVNFKCSYSIASWQKETLQGIGRDLI